MPSTKHYFAFALAGLFSGVLTSSILIGLLGVVAGVAMWYFRTFDSNSANKWTPLELCFNVVFGVACFFSVFLVPRHPQLIWLAAPFLGGFIGMIIVGTLLTVFGPNRR
jgi:hypothetical protein